MTLITAAEGNEFVVLATDSKGSWIDGSGTRIDSINAEKLIPLSKYSCVLIADDAEVGLQLVEEFKKQFKNNNLGITKIVKEFSKFCKKEISHISDSISPSNPAFPSVVFIVAGLDKERKKYIPKINILRSERLFYPGRVKEKAADGKPMIAHYILNKEYDKNYSQEDMCFLLGKVMVETVKVDGDVGGKIRMAIINQKGVRILPDNIVDIYVTDKESYKRIRENKELEDIIKEQT